MEKYRTFSLSIILIPTLDFPHFYYMLGGHLVSLLYGDVSVMIDSIVGQNTLIICCFVLNEFYEYGNVHVTGSSHLGNNI